MPDPAAVEVGEAVRQACLTAALAAYEDAGIRGLCAEGRWELAIDAMRALELVPILREASAEGEAPSPLNQPEQRQEPDA